jgi:hypothetical protein
MGSATKTHQNRRKKPFLGFPDFPRVCFGAYERPRDAGGVVSEDTARDSIQGSR